MYCPKCGQSQVSADVRFCSRCGFPLLAAAELLAAGGVPPVHPAADPGAGPRPASPRRRGVKRGIGIILMGILLLPFFGIMHEAVGTPEGFMIIALFVTMIGFLRLIFAAFFEEAAPRVIAPPQLYTPPIASRLHAPAQEPLPAARGVSANDYRQPQVHTSEIMRPPSVTDHTTRLLDKQVDTSEQ